MSNSQITNLGDLAHVSIEDSLPEMIDQRVGDHFDMYFARFLENNLKITLTELKDIVKEHYPERFI